MRMSAKIIKLHLAKNRKPASQKQSVKQAPPVQAHHPHDDIDAGVIIRLCNMLDCPPADILEYVEE